MNKPNCYDCIHRRNLIGDAHSACAHPETGVTDGGDVMGNLVKLVGGECLPAVRKLKVRGNLHGIQSGWFYWPANFDPVWLENCEGFTPKPKEDAPK